MKRKKIYITLGLITALVPFLGFPSHIRTAIFVVTGLMIVLLAFTQKNRVESVRIENKEFSDDKEE